MILQLKEYYRYIIFHLNIESEFKTEYSLDYLSFYQNRNEINKTLNIIETIKQQSKNRYKILLCLSPGLLKFMDFNNKENIRNYSVPKISGICENHKKIFFNDMNITIVKYDYSKEIFLMKNGFNYLCLQFEYFYQFANYFLLNNQKLEGVEQNDEIMFYQDNKDICINMIKSSISNILLLLVKFMYDLNLSNFSVVLKQLFTTLFSAIKSLNKISVIIDSIVNILMSIIIVIYEQFIEANTKLKQEKIKRSNISLNDINNYLIYFRDGIIDFILSNELYEKTTAQFNLLLFEKIIPIFERNEMDEIISTYPNIFIKILSFTSIISELFLDFDPKKYISNKKGNNNNLLYKHLKFIKSLIILRKKNSKDDIFYNQLFKFALIDYRHNQYVNFAFLTVINDLFKDGFSLNENEIMDLIDYLNKEVLITKEINLDSNNEINEENQEKFKNDLSSLILTISIDCIFETNKKKKLNQFCHKIKKIELNEKSFLAIINELMNIFSRNMDSKNMNAIKYVSIDNKVKEKTNYSSSKSLTKEENFDFMNFYEDLFYFILILLEIKLCKEENINYNINNDNLNENKNNNINNNNIINNKKIDLIKLELMNLLFFIEEMINANINNKNIQISSIYCLINLLKLLHIITFDEKLKCLYSENKFLLLFKSILETCFNSN